MKPFLYVIACMFIMSCSNAPKEKTVETSYFETKDADFEADVKESDTDLYDALSDNEIIEGTVDEGETLEATTKSSNTNWDKAIDEYEKYIDEYLKFVKKGQAGDMKALTKSLELMEKAESASKRLEEAKDSEMTNAQIKRMLKIQNKMIDAL